MDRRLSDQPVAYRKRATDTEPEGIRVQDIISNVRDLQLIDLERSNFRSPRRRSAATITSFW